MRLTIPFALLLLAAILPSPARADTVCVSTVSGLVQAINAFEFQPDDTVHTIKVVQGNYAVGAQLIAMPRKTLENQVGLKLLGGYAPGCGSRTINPANTTIDAGGQANTALLFWLSYEADALVEGITFTGFVAAGGGPVLELFHNLGIGDDHAFTVRNCRFVGNRGNQIVSLLGARLDVVNNLVAGNTLVGGGANAVRLLFDYEANSRAVVNDNTIASNTGGDGLLVSTDGRSSERLSEISSNVLWNNAGVDLRIDPPGLAGAPAPLVVHNQLGDSSGITLAASNSTANPQFVNAGAGNYRLAAGSPAINTGAPIQIYGFPAKDLDGGTRILGSQIDRGAYEASADDQSSFLVTTASDNGNNTSPITGSLRAAIKAANAAVGPFKINFSIAGSCPRIVSLAAPMLDITGDVTIDGRTQPGWAANSLYGAFDGTLCLVLNGTGSTPYALRVPAGADNARLVVHGLMFAGFADAAIRLEDGQSHRIAGNQFGAVPFTAANHDAIRVTGGSGGAFIGGYDDPGAVNLIAGSSNVGIYLDNAAGGSTLANNVIGLQVDGLGVGGNGIGVYAFNSPGNALQYNYIAYSAAQGVALSGAATIGTQLQYNLIGRNRDGGPAGNLGPGVAILFGAQGSTVGATQGGIFGRNEIVNNGGPGVWVTPSGGGGNRVLANISHGNAQLDLDLGGAGASANQANNPGVGPNRLQNYPVLASAVRSGNQLAVSGSLHSAPAGSYRIDLYFSPICSPTVPSRGVPRRHLGQFQVSTNANGDAMLSAVLGAPPFVLGTISATATSAGGDTSEIGNCVSETNGTLPPLLFSNGFE